MSRSFARCRSSPALVEQQGEGGGDAGQGILPDHGLRRGCEAAPALATELPKLVELISIEVLVPLEVCGSLAALLG